MTYSEDQLIQLAEIIERGIAGEDIDLTLIDQYPWDDEMMIQVEPYLHDRKALRWLWSWGPIENCHMYDFTEYKEREESARSILRSEKRSQQIKEGPSDEESDKQFMLLYLNMIQMQFLFLCNRVRKAVTDHPEWFGQVIADGLDAIMINEIDNSNTLEKMMHCTTE